MKHLGFAKKIAAEDRRLHSYEKAYLCALISIAESLEKIAKWVEAPTEVIWTNPFDYEENQ